MAVHLTHVAIIVQLARGRVLGRRGFAKESVAARTRREAGGRVRTNMLVRDMDLGVPIADGGRLEVVVPLEGRAQLAVDTTLCTQTVGRDSVLQSMMVQAQQNHCLLRIGWSPTAESSWWFWQPRWVVAGRRRPECP